MQRKMRLPLKKEEFHQIKFTFLLLAGKNIFLFTFEKQSTHLNRLYNALKDNPHIPVAPFIVADNEAMIYEFMERSSWDAYVIGPVEWELSF